MSDTTVNKKPSALHLRFTAVHNNYSALYLQSSAVHRWTHAVKEDSSAVYNQAVLWKWKARRDERIPNRSLVVMES